MNRIVILLTALVLLAGCKTTVVDTSATSQTTEPIKLKVGMTKADVLELLGTPMKKTSQSLDSGSIVETWIYRILVKEWRTIQDTDFETIEKVNLITGEVYEEVVPVESTVLRRLFQEITLKIGADKVIFLDTDLIEDLDAYP